MGGCVSAVSVETQAQEVKALMTIGGTAAGAVGVLSVYFRPAVFQPWPVALGAFFLAGLAGAVSFWTLANRKHVFPLVILLLPCYRAALLFLRHGLPPWPVTGWGWLAGDGFPWWAGASLLAACYAGTMAANYARIRPRAIFLTGPIAEDPKYTRWRFLHVGKEDVAHLHYQTLSRQYTRIVFFGAALFTIVRPAGERLLVLSCAAAFLVLGFYFIGLAHARRMAVAWLEEGFETPPDIERRWWSSYGRYVWPLLLVLLFLPGGFRPLHLEDLLRFLPGFTPRLKNMDAIKRQEAVINGSRLGTPNLGWLNHVMNISLTAVQCLSLVLAMGVIVYVIFLLLRGLLRVLLDWLRGFGPVWRGLGRFLTALRRLLWRISSPAAEIFRRGHGRSLSSPGTKTSARSQRLVWPSSPIRRLFAKLAFWGRGQGLLLRPSLTPDEIGRGLMPLAPEGGDDLALLVEGYRRERYGEKKPSRQELKLYREAWERTVRQKSGSPGEEPERTGK